MTAAIVVVVLLVLLAVGLGVLGLREHRARRVAEARALAAREGAARAEERRALDAAAAREREAQERAAARELERRLRRAPTEAEVDGTLDAIERRHGR